MTRTERKRLEWDAVHAARKAVRTGAIKPAEWRDYREAVLAAAIIREELEPA